MTPSSEAKVSGLPRLRSKWKPSRSSIRPSITASAIRSASTRRRRFTSPGGRRITWVTWATPSSPCPRSANETMIAEGLDQTSAARPRRGAERAMALSRRGAVVPYWCSRRASSVRKAMRVLIAVVAKATGTVSGTASANIHRLHAQGRAIDAHDFHGGAERKVRPRHQPHAVTHLRLAAPVHDRLAQRVALADQLFAAPVEPFVAGGN